MKKLLFIILATVVFIGACKKENFLDRFPPDDLTDPTFFKNENDLKLYANRFYVPFTAITSVLDGNADNNSDNVVPASRNTFLAGTYTIPSTATAASGWTWTDIRAANYFLARYEKADIADVVKNRYAGEVRFFRAFFYWQKVKQFGDVPWISKDLNETSPELFAARTPRKQVMDSVLVDLNYAVANLPSFTTATMNPATDRGRLHKYAALALKARICLWEGTFRKYHGLGDETPYLQAAADAALEIMNSTQYDIHKTNAPTRDYNSLFLIEDLNTNKEAILSKTYMKDVVMHNSARQVGQSNNGFSKNFARQFLMKDGLPTGLSPLYQGDDSLATEKIDRDPRFAQLIATRGFVFVANPTGANDTILLPRIGTSVTSTGYQIAKFRSPDPAQINANQSTYDLFIFRYAETLLIYAEAKAELGQADQAVIDATINKIRGRVNMAPMVIADLQKDPNSDFPAVPVLIDEIRRERRIELALEGQRFDDLLRWKAGKQIENAETILGMKLLPSMRAKYTSNTVQNMQVTADFYIRVYTNITARVWNDKSYFYPIPTQELTLNPALGQNPGWQ